MTESKKEAAGTDLSDGSRTSNKTALNAIEILPDSACVDMLRFTFDHEKTMDDCRILQVLDTAVFSGDSPTTWTVKGCPGKYRIMYRVPSGDSSITVGLFLVDGKCRTLGRGFIEFNPQKVERSDVVKLWQCIDNPECARWDFACDYSIPRKRFHLLKGASTYELYCGKDGSVTEYRGQRNQPGRVKVYDKGKELGLPDGENRTRVEITCEPGGYVWPKIIYIESLDVKICRGDAGTFAIVALRNGATVQELLSSIDDSQTRWRYGKYFERAFGTLANPLELYSECSNQIDLWEQGRVMM